MKSSHFLRLAVGVALVGLASSSAFAQDPAAAGVDASTLIGLIKGSMARAINNLTSHAISWLGAFATLQFLITNYKLLTSDADLQTALAKFTGGVVWVGVCLLSIQNGPSFISAVGDSFFTMLGFDMPSTGAIVKYTVAGFGSIAALAWGVGYASNTMGLLLVCVAFAVLAIGMYFAFKVFMLQLELAMIVMLSPLSFAFLGLNTLRDQGIAPFKALISLAYRIILLTVILSAFMMVSQVTGAYIDGVGKESFLAGIGAAAEGVGTALGGYLLLAYLTFKSDSIAASLASGTTSMGTADVASAAAAGAAMGAAVISGGAAAAGVASSAPQSMRDFLGSMMGGGGQVSNASAMGSADPAPLPSLGGSPSFSMGGRSAGGPAGQTGSSSSGSASPGSDARQLQAGQATPDAGAYAGREAAAPQQAEKVASGRIGPDLSGEGGGQGQGSGQTASISGAGGNDMAELSKRIGNLTQQLAQSNAPKKPSLQDRLANANQHMAKEQDRVQVSVNPHHHD